LDLVNFQIACFHVIIPPPKKDSVCRIPTWQTWWLVAAGVCGVWTDSGRGGGQGGDKGGVEDGLLVYMGRVDLDLQRSFVVGSAAGMKK
jgi:hypothetical protein